MSNIHQLCLAKTQENWVKTQENWRKTQGKLGKPPRKSKTFAIFFKKMKKFAERN